MLTLGFLFILILGLIVGAIVGLATGTTRTREARDVRRYNDAIALARDIISTPDALDLRDRARKIVVSHEAAHNNRKDA